jgi:small subunit ribosomal protein S16
MLTLKLKRIGKKHQSAFRLIAIEKRTKLNGRYLEDFGFYNPHEDKFEFNKDRILYWLKNGAQPTDTVHNLLIKAGIIKGKKIPVHKEAETKKEEATITGASATSTVAPTPETKPTA